MSEMTKKLRTAGYGLAALGMLTFATCVEYVKPNEVGVLQVNNDIPFITGPKGYSKEIMNGKRYHWVTPVLETLHRYPKEIQLLSLHNREENEEDSDQIQVLPRARIETSDNFPVLMDIDMLYRIKDPRLLIEKAGPGLLYRTSVIEKNVESGLKASLGMYQPQEFFQTEDQGENIGRVKRIAAQKQAKEELNRKMAPYGLEVIDVFIRGTQYTSDVQTQLEEKSVADQQNLTNLAQAALAIEQGLLDKIKTEGVQAAELRRREGEAYRDKILGEKDSYVKSRQSEGDKLVQIAEAEKTRLQNVAYQGAGSDLLVGLENAKVVCGLQRILMPVCGSQDSPLNLEHMTRMVSGAKR